MGRRTTTAVAALALLVGVTSAAGGVEVAASGSTTPADPLAPQPLAERTGITVTMSAPIETYLNVLLADALGEFDRENLDVEISFVPAADNPLVVAQGRADVALNTLTAGLYNLIADGSDLRVVAGAARPNPEAYEGFWVRRDVLGGDGFQPHDIVDEAMATPFGSASGIYGAFLRQADELEPGVLTAQGLVHEVLPLADGVTALQNGAVNVAMAVQPFSVALSSEDCCEYIGLWPEYSTAVTIFGPTLLEDDRDAGLAFVRAVARTVRDHMVEDYRADPQLAEQAAAVLEQPLDAFLAGLTPDWGVQLWEQFFTETQDYFLAVGGMLQYETPLTVDQVYDNGFLDELGLAEG